VQNDNIEKQHLPKWEQLTGFSGMADTAVSVNECDDKVLCFLCCAFGVRGTWTVKPLFE
jgi:hypothetical protein